jgi:hypothetical protein
MLSFDAPLVARFFAIEELRASGWKHRPEAALPTKKQQDAERMWSGATYCPECAARAAARGRGAAATAR